MSTGNKVTCVFVHGWAMNSCVWKSCLQYLPDWIEVVQVDLPGYGDRVEAEAAGIDDYVQLLSGVIDRPAIWVGWSLGGLAVLRLARLYPELVTGLFIVAANPCFVRRHDWKPAVELDIFEQFAQALQQDIDSTVKRFLTLQVKGSDSAMKVVREINQAYRLSKRPSKVTLKLGLDVLATTDLRNELSLLECPVTWLLGARDTLVPEALAEDLKILHPEIDVLVEAGAAHAPFISHPQVFANKLVSMVKHLR